MNKHGEWQSRIKAVEREFLIASKALALLDRAIERDPGLLQREKFQAVDLNRTKDYLEARYLISLFAVFEAGIREVWEKPLGQTTTPRTRDLLEGAAARRQMSPQDLANAHTVREYRNSIVHEGEETLTVPLAQARRHLYTFFKWMPLDWQ